MSYRGKQKSVPEILIELREDDQEFKRALVAHSFRAGQTVADPEMLACNLFTLMKGRVQLIREGPNGRRLAIATLGPGSLFGEGALLGATDPCVKAVALTDCICWMLPVAAGRGFGLPLSDSELGVAPDGWASPGASRKPHGRGRLQAPAGAPGGSAAGVGQRRTFDSRHQPSVVGRHAGHLSGNDQRDPAWFQR